MTQLYNNDNQIAVLSFYCFTTICAPEEILPKILFIAKRKRIRGTVILAHEGFNGSISGSESDLRLLVSKITEYTNADNIESKVNYCNNHPFSKIKVKIKEEIVTMRSGDIDVNALKGDYIEPKDWDEFINKDDVVVIDTRNSYEVDMGSFKNALDPSTSDFKEFPNWARNNSEVFKDKKIAMFCTGGIRCEKSTAFMKQLGYNEVYHLKGGILQYLEDTGNKNNQWQGECFVFDDRISVTDDLRPASSGSCDNNDIRNDKAI